MRWREYLLGGVALAAVIAVFCLPPIPQNPAYHALADARTVAGVANFWNVFSNLGFLLVGLFALSRRTQLRSTPPRPAYLIFSIAVIGVAFGSAYYHLAPCTATLVWDRVPITAAFMALFSIILADRVSGRLGAVILWPALFAGIASVVYWYWTESRGVGDLRPYAIVQFLPMLLIPLILVVFPGDRRSAVWMWNAFVVYVLAKLAEHFDGEIFAATDFVSGHSIKHVLGAVSVLFIVLAMQNLSGKESADPSIAHGRPA